MTSSDASASCWSLPNEARARALRQHATIRTLLWSAASTAPAAEQGSTAARADLLSLVAKLRWVRELSRLITNLTVDMEYEERTFLAADAIHADAVGAKRTAD